MRTAPPSPPLVPHAAQGPQHPAPPNAAPGLSLGEKVQLIKSELCLAAALPMAAAIAEANEQMGVPAEGALPGQADRLMAVMGLPRGRG